MREVDKGILSDKPMELRQIEELLTKAPDIREDMVIDLKSQIFRGMYKVKAEQVTEKLMQHGIHIFIMLGRKSLYPY